MAGQRGRGRPAPCIAEEASSSMSLQWLPSGCCAGPGRQAHMASTRAPEGPRKDGGPGGASIQLRGLDTDQLRGSLVVLYAPAGNSCLLRLVGHAVDGCMHACLDARMHEGKDGCKGGALCCAVLSSHVSCCVHALLEVSGLRSCSPGGRL